MPVILPNPAELSDLSWHKRDRAVLTARSLLRTYTGMAEPSEPRRWRATPEERQRRREWAAARLAEWGEAVRAEARVLLACTPVDPDAEQHRNELENAMRRTR